MGKPTSPGRWVVLVFLSIVLAGIALALLSDGPSQPGTRAEEAVKRDGLVNPRLEAWLMAQQFVRKNLLTPSTARFSYWTEIQSYDDCVTQTDKYKFHVEGWVDAENAFGAKVRNYFRCKLTYLGNDQWRCDELTINPN